MDDWRALDHAMLLATAYRGSPRLEKALELLKINDYDALRSEKTPLIPGALTWAMSKRAGISKRARVNKRARMNKRVRKGGARAYGP